MQPLDPADPRRPNVQISASIRAAVLSGELQPGSRLPTGEELAKFFGVSRQTIHTAIRTLADEGFVRSRTGSGVFVLEQASLPVPDRKEHELAGIAAYLFEMGRLKHVERAGWTLLGIPSPETVAEHSFRVTITGIALAALEGANVGHTAAMCALHDSPESRIGDVPSVGRAYTTTAAPEVIGTHQVAAMPDEAAKVFQELLREYEAGETLESRVARDADKLETLLQAAEYAAQGHATGPWRETSVTALRTDSAKQLAQAINATDPHAWWSPFARSYHELRASAQGRSRKDADPLPGHKVETGRLHADGR